MSSMRRGLAPRDWSVPDDLASNRLQCCREGVRPQENPATTLLVAVSRTLPTSEGVAIVQHGPSAAFASTSLTLLGGIVEPLRRGTTATAVEIFRLLISRSRCVLRNGLPTTAQCDLDSSPTLCFSRSVEALAAAVRLLGIARYATADPRSYGHATRRTPRFYRRHPIKGIPGSLQPRIFASVASVECCRFVELPPSNRTG